MQGCTFIPWVGQLPNRTVQGCECRAVAEQNGAGLSRYTSGRVATEQNSTGLYFYTRGKAGA